MASSQGIYKRCEEPEEQEKKPNKMLETAASFLPQRCRGGSGPSMLIILVNIASFLLWIIVVAVMASKYSKISMELEELRLNQTSLIKKGESTEKQLKLIHSNHSVEETALNKNLGKLENEYNSLKKGANERMDRIETQSNGNSHTVYELIKAFHSINASGCQICPNGGLLYKEKCYYFKMESQAWSLANTKCNHDGSNLVIIDDRDEQYFLNHHLNGKTLWIGLSDIKSEGDFAWVDGTTPKYTNWRYGEPNNAGKGEDCVVTVDRGWEDRPCGQSVEGWICEKPWACF